MCATTTSFGKQTHFEWKFLMRSRMLVIVLFLLFLMLYVDADIGGQDAQVPRRIDWWWVTTPSGAFWWKVPRLPAFHTPQNFVVWNSASWRLDAWHGSSLYRCWFVENGFRIRVSRYHFPFSEKYSLNIAVYKSVPREHTELQVLDNSELYFYM